MLIVISRQGPGISVEIETFMPRRKSGTTSMVARGLASRLRLKLPGRITLLACGDCRQGPGISVEIETMEHLSPQRAGPHVARGLASRLRLKHCLDTQQIEAIRA